MKVIRNLLCIMLTIGVMYGCNGKSNDDKANHDTSYENTRANIKEDIIGSWGSSGGGYMTFFENGDVGILNTSTGNSSLMNYNIDDDTVTLYSKSGTLHLYSVEVTGNTLTYISESGNKNVWNSVSNDEVAAAMKQ